VEQYKIKSGALALNVSGLFICHRDLKTTKKRTAETVRAF
jgi:hypothetical protein